MDIDRRLAFAGLGSLAALASVPAARAQADTETEIFEFRQNLREAIKRKDKAAITAALHERFAHWRDSGKFQNRDARLVDLVDGVPTIESVVEDDLVMTSYGPTIVIANGTTRIAVNQGAEPTDFRWMAIHAKEGGRWQLLASMATRLVKG